MVDQVSIINGAIGLVGGEAISSVPADINNSEIPNQSRWCVRLYASVYESTLSLWPWNDARRRRVAEKRGEAPAFGYAAQYALQPDELKVCGVRNLGKSWKREGRFILHDGGPTLSIITITRVPAEQLNALTADLVSARLAYRAASAMTEMAAARKAELRQGVQDRLLEALSADNWEGSSEQVLSSGWWLASMSGYRPEIEAIGDGVGRGGWLESVS